MRPALMRTLRRYPLLLFFGISYGLTWAYELVTFVALGRRPIGLLIVPALLGPSVATWTATALIDGREGLQRLLRRYVRWRVSPCLDCKRDTDGWLAL